MNKPRNEDFYRAMLELRRSNATRPHKAKAKGNRRAQKRAAINDSLKG